MVADWTLRNHFYEKMTMHRSSTCLIPIISLVDTKRISSQQVFNKKEHMLMFVAESIVIQIKVRQGIYQ
jgi:hypothetical protein